MSPLQALGRVAALSRVRDDCGALSVVWIRAVIVAAVLAGAVLVLAVLLLAVAVLGAWLEERDGDL